MAIEIRNQVQTELEVDIPISQLMKNVNITTLAVEIKKQLTNIEGEPIVTIDNRFLQPDENTLQPILVPIKTKGSQPPLFCIHPIGGNVLCYAQLANHLNADYPVYGLQSLGLDGLQQPLTSISEMASYYLEAIRQIHPQGPYHLIGWSVGGLIAYEIAQQLLAKNESVALLSLIDTYAPTVIPSALKIDEAMILNQFVQDLGGLNGQRLDISLEKLRQLKPDEQVKHLFEQVKQQAIFPTEIKLEHMSSLWEVFQANMSAAYHYQPKAYPGSILLFKASETPIETIEDATQGWGSLVLSKIQTYTITGDHYTIMKAPQIKCLTEKLNNHVGMIKTQKNKK